MGSGEAVKVHFVHFLVREAVKEHFLRPPVLRRCRRAQKNRAPISWGRKNPALTGVLEVLMGVLEVLMGVQEKGREAHSFFRQLRGRWVLMGMQELMGVLEVLMGVQELMLC